MKILDILSESQGLDDLANGRDHLPVERFGSQAENKVNTTILDDAVVDAREAWQLSKIYKNRHDRPYNWKQQREWVMAHQKSDSIHGGEGTTGAFANNFPKRYIAEYGPRSRNAGTASYGGATQEDIDEQDNAYVEGRSSAAKKGTDQTGQANQNTDLVNRFIQDDAVNGGLAREAQQRKIAAASNATVDATANRNVKRYAIAKDPVATTTPLNVKHAAQSAQAAQAKVNSDNHFQRKIDHPAGIADGSIEADVPREETVVPAANAPTKGIDTPNAIRVKARRAAQKAKQAKKDAAFRASIAAQEGNGGL